ncbi:PPE family protein, partial [Mycobacterium tuberculosis]|nr:PPE family protein [Mycobacterium tuberculosis]
GLPYDAYTNPGTLMWWIARSLELLQDFQEFAKLLFTNPVKAFQFLVDLILFDWPTHMLQLATWLAENPQLLVAALTPAISGLGAVSGLAGLTGLVPQPPVVPAPAPDAVVPTVLPLAGTATPTTNRARRKCADSKCICKVQP